MKIKQNYSVVRSIANDLLPYLYDTKPFKDAEKSLNKTFPKVLWKKHVNNPTIAAIDPEMLPRIKSFNINWNYLGATAKHSILVDTSLHLPIPANDPRFSYYNEVTITLDVIKDQQLIKSFLVRYDQFKKAQKERQEFFTKLYETINSYDTLAKLKKDFPKIDDLLPAPFGKLDNGKKPSQTDIEAFKEVMALRLAAI